jgi:hypothetical protein
MFRNSFRSFLHAGEVSAFQMTFPQIKYIVKTQLTLKLLEILKL